jgi:hypothetical protein
MPNLDDLAAALDNHQVTNNEGELMEETTSQEESAPQEQTPAEEAATVEKPAETEESVPTETKATENEPEMVELAADETGKRYVPESRFKEVYAKWKDAERKSSTLPLPTVPQPAVQQKPLEKTDALEIELLRSTLPQFNPESSDYSQEIDELGYSLYEGSKDIKGRYTMTRIDAGRKALSMAKKITSKIAEIKTEARTVKAQQSDQGITNRVLNREAKQLDPGKMSLSEMEEWLKTNNEW